MADHIIESMVKEIVATYTTADFTLDTNPVDGFRSFWDVMWEDGQTTYYMARDASGQWESGVGTLADAGTKLLRTEIIKSSNFSAAVEFDGEVTLFIDMPGVRLRMASAKVFLDADDQALTSATDADVAFDGQETVQGMYFAPAGSLEGGPGVYVVSWRIEVTGTGLSAARFDLYCGNSISGYSLLAEGTPAPVIGGKCVSVGSAHVVLPNFPPEELALNTIKIRGQATGSSGLEIVKGATKTYLHVAQVRPVERGEIPVPE